MNAQEVANLHQGPGWLRLFRRQRPLLGMVMALVIPSLLELIVSVLDYRDFPVVLLLHLLSAVVVAAVGGVWPAVVASVLATAFLNVFSTAPYGSWSIDDAKGVITLVIFLIVACSMAVAVGLAGHRAEQAEQARDESSLINSLALRILSADDSFESFLHRLSDTLSGRSVSLLEVVDDAGQERWEAPAERLLAASSPEAPVRSAAAGAYVAVGDEYRLLVGGPPLDSRQEHLLQAFVALVVAVRKRQALLQSRAENARLSEGNIMRTAILQAVSHDLRTPIAGIKLNVASLRQKDIRFAPDVEAELLADVEDYVDRLDSLVANLLDMSRIMGDSTAPLTRPTAWESVLPNALRGVPAELVDADLTPTREVLADPGMLERAVANVLENAVTHGQRTPVRVSSAVVTEAGKYWAELRIADHGPGMDLERQEQLFQPFQSTQDTERDGVHGLGLGLAVARGFLSAMGGTIHAEATPGGGTTMVLRLPAVGSQP